MRKHYKLKDLSSVITSGSRGWAEYYSDIGSLFLRMTNLPKNGIKLLFDNNKYVQLPSNSQEGKRTAVQNDDILISITAELGKIGYVENINDAYVNQHVCLVRINHKQVYSKFIAYYLSSNPSRNLLNRMNDAGAKAGLNLSTIANFPILLPPLHTQRAIADMLDVWDRAIEKTDALVKAKEKKFGWLVTKCINKSNYKKKQLSDFIDEVSIRNKDNKTERVLSVTNHRGFVLPQEHFERRIASADLSNYKIVLNGEYAYNPSRINVGSIARLEQWDIGVLSPMYTAFKINHTKTNSDYFFYWIFSSETRQRIKNTSQGSVRETVSFDSLSSLLIPLPPLSEQRHIAHILNTARSEINLLKKLATQYRTQKQALMQKLLSGTWGVR